MTNRKFSVIRCWAEKSPICYLLFSICYVGEPKASPPAIPTELYLLRHFPGQISDHSRLSDRPGDRPKLSRHGTGKACAWRPDASAAFIKVDLFRSPW